MIEAFARINAHVVTALRTNREIGLDIGVVQNRFTTTALYPQALGHSLAISRITLLDLGRKNFINPAHGAIVTILVSDLMRGGFHE
jgi:hypothetical protein